MLFGIFHVKIGKVRENAPHFSEVNKMSPNGLLFNRWLGFEAFKIVVLVLDTVAEARRPQLQVRASYFF